MNLKGGEQSPSFLLPVDCRKTGLLQNRIELTFVRFTKPLAIARGNYFKTRKLMQINYLFIMLDYIFFNEKTCRLFEKYATSAGISVIIDYKEKHFIVRLTEDSDKVSLEKTGRFFG